MLTYKITYCGLTEFSDLVAEGNSYRPLSENSELQFFQIATIYSHCSTLCFGQTPILRACVLVCVPAGRLAGTHTAAASGAVGPFDAAKYSPDAADGGEPREPRPGCSEPAKKTQMLIRQ